MLGGGDMLDGGTILGRAGMLGGAACRIIASIGLGMTGSMEVAIGMRRPLVG